MHYLTQSHNGDLVPRMCAPLLYCFDSLTEGGSINVAYLTRAGLHKCQVTELCLVAPVIFSMIAEVAPCMCKCVSVHITQQQAPVQFTVLYRIVYGTCFVSPSWLQEF